MDTSARRHANVSTVPHVTQCLETVTAVQGGKVSSVNRVCPVVEGYFEHCIVWFQKISKPPPQRVTGNSEGEGVLKAKIFKGKYEPKLQFPEGWRVQTKKPSVGVVWIFSGTK